MIFLSAHFLTGNRNFECARLLHDVLLFNRFEVQKKSPLQTLWQFKKGKKIKKKTPLQAVAASLSVFTFH